MQHEHRRRCCCAVHLGLFRASPSLPEPVHDSGDKQAVFLHCTHQPLQRSCWPPRPVLHLFQRGKHVSAEKPEQQELVFSAKTWEGDYSSKDVPGGVETTPVVGAIYAVKGDGTGLKKVVGLGKNTDYPTVSPDGQWVYFFGANYAYNMRHDKKAIARAWHAIETRLESLRQAPRPSRFAHPEKRTVRRRAS